MKHIQVIKVGGNILDDPATLDAFLDTFSAINLPRILVHGGGKEASALATAMGIETRMIDGRRITDAEMLKVVTMVYGGLLNKNIVAKLQARGCNALGLTGADLNIIPAHKRQNADIDFGFVGDFEAEDIQTKPLVNLLQQGVTPVFCALTHDGLGNLLNTNADTIAAGLAASLAPSAEVSLHLCFEKRGVLKNSEDDSSLMDQLTEKTFNAMKVNKTIHSGMIPKLENGFMALHRGVQNVIIRHALYEAGTSLHHA